MAETRTLDCPVCGVAKDFVVKAVIHPPDSTYATVRICECPTCKTLRVG